MEKIIKKEKTNQDADKEDRQDGRQEDKIRWRKII